MCIQQHQKLAFFVWLDHSWILFHTCSSPVATARVQHTLTHTLRNCVSGSFYAHPLLHQYLRNVSIIGNSLQSAAKTVAAEVLKKHQVSAYKTAIRLAEDVKALYMETRFRTFQKTSPTLL